MVEKIAELLNKLETDPWRRDGGFTPEMEETLKLVLNSRSEDEIKSVLNAWVRKHQPCLFGRIAAKQSAITFCLIPEEMLFGREEDVQKHIQNSRLSWTAAAFEGKTSNFIIAVLSSKLALATPNEVVKKIAIRLCSLYLNRPITPDRVYLDRLWLEKPGSKKATWEWAAGVNYFSAQGDRRWWQDHRFPAGIAFSTNSVGHMVKSGRLARDLHDLEEAVGRTLPNYRPPNVDSLEKALGLAMGTIHNASDAVSGKATYLLPLAGNQDERPVCPGELPPSLSAFDCCKYEGFYHTDYTIPSSYFRPEVDRPADVNHPFDLDFTYLFHEALDNPDYDRMGEGRRIRLAEGVIEGVSESGSYPATKRLRGLETEVQISDIPRLQEALRLPSKG